MTQPSLVLCPVDFSPPSADIARHAVAFAAIAQSLAGAARVTLLHVIEPLLVQAAAMSGDQTRLQDDCRHALAALASSVASTALAEPPALEIRTGLPHVEILKAAAERHATLIVLGTQGQTGAARLFFGSTAQRVLRETATPVLVVPPGASPLVQNGAAGPTLALAHIIAAVDFGDTTAVTVQAAAGLAARTGAALTLAHAVTPARGLERWSGMVEAHQAQRVAKAGEELAMLAREVQAQVPEARASVTEGEAERVLASLAGQMPGTVMVMGVRRGGGLLGPQPGSTAYRVLSLSHVPVLVVPARLR
jgi:nucleotide-binding universal stress UspA family protein